jgi:hypothetical protein
MATSMYTASELARLLERWERSGLSSAPRAGICGSCVRRGWPPRCGRRRILQCSKGFAMSFTLVDNRWQRDAASRASGLKVCNQSDALVARYTYNAWGFRTTWQYDSVVNGTVNSDDPIFCSLYDEKWRIVGISRYAPGTAENGGKNEPAKEMFIYHAAGLAGSWGLGGSSYIDAVILRAGYDPEDWTNPVDAEPGGFTHIHYLLQNWRGDVSLVVTDAARVIEWVQYWAYGVPFGIPAGNASSNGANNVEDLSTLINWIGNEVWDARWDLNADGSVTVADYACYPEKTLGRGKLSWVNNRIGYAGYQHAPELAGTKYLLRHRWLLANLGEWLRMSPLEGGHSRAIAPLLAFNEQVEAALLAILLPSTLVIAETAHTQQRCSSRPSRRGRLQERRCHTGRNGEECACVYLANGWVCSVCPAGCQAGRCVSTRTVQYDQVSRSNRGDIQPLGRAQVQSDWPKAQATVQPGLAFCLRPWPNPRVCADGAGANLGLTCEECCRTIGGDMDVQCRLCFPDPSACRAGIAAWADLCLEACREAVF